jgi:CxxC motif-containing protein (DUF1111 family)
VRASRAPGQRIATGLVALVLAGALLAACADGGSSGPAPAAAPGPTREELVRQGGAATVLDEGASAFAQPIGGLTGEQRRQFAVGNSFFNQNWVTAPASTEARDGLGPIFNAQSCSSCHFKDGRGQPPVDADDPERGLLVRLSVIGEDGQPEAHPELGSQFQDRSIRGVPAEGTVRIEITERPGTYPDGTPYSLAAPTYVLVRPDGSVVADVAVSPRVAPAMLGVGLLEAIPEEVVLSQADPDDADGDGISGRAHLITDAETGEQVLGRFGWKAAVPTLEAQNAAAFVNDIGITSPVDPEGPCTDAQAACRAAPDGGDPELDADKLDTITFYTRTLAVPARRDVGAADTVAGQERFEAIGCASCHTPELTTGASDLEPLAEQAIRPYTDLLLHDLGPALADDRPDVDATGREWRTPPLWGIGLVETVNRHTRFLHDGRARSIEEAILWHGGEAETSRVRFTELPAVQREQVLTFLESL